MSSMVTKYNTSKCPDSNTFPLNKSFCKQSFTFVALKGCHSSIFSSKFLQTSHSSHQLSLKLNLDEKVFCFFSLTHSFMFGVVSLVKACKSKSLRDYCHSNPGNWFGVTWSSLKGSVLLSSALAAGCVIHLVQLNSTTICQDNTTNRIARGHG